VDDPYTWIPCDCGTSRDCKFKSRKR
jgi:hypothetical protein